MTSETPITRLITAKCVQNILTSAAGLDKDEVFDQMVASIPEPYDEALALQWYGEHESHAGVMEVLSLPQFVPEVQAIITENPEYDEIMVLYQMTWYMAFEEAWSIIKPLGEAIPKSLTSGSRPSQS
jgi:hypothetical protein